MDQLEHGRDCFRRRAWRTAYETLSAADQASPLDRDDLDRLASAAFLTGRESEFLEIHERLHRLHVAADDRVRAARSTFWLGLMLLFGGKVAQAGAWIARGHRLLEGRASTEHGYLLLVAGEQQLRDGRAEAADATFDEALVIGRRTADADLVAAAQHGRGRALIDRGDIAAGLRCLDETMLATVAGDLSPILTALMYCSVIDACQQVYALGRAREWTKAFSRVCDQQPEMVAFTGVCLVHRAEILQLQGAWPDALSEARRAGDAFGALGPPGSALYQQAEIHRLCGAFEEAERGYHAASERGFEPQPGLALLRLAQGRVEVACATIRRLIAARGSRLRRARLLPAHLEIALAAGDLDGARGARDELHEVAEAFGSEVLRALAAQADGAIALADGDAPSALDALRRAFEIWEHVEAPYEAARVRVLIGQACLGLGDGETAELERRAARSTFERLGAQPDLVRLDAASAGPACPHPTLTQREIEVLRLISTGQTNRAIAGALGVSERTVDRHVSNILAKLAVPSRAAATACAIHRKLL